MNEQFERKKENLTIGFSATVIIITLYECSSIKLKTTHTAIFVLTNLLSTLMDINALLNLLPITEYRLKYIYMYNV